MQLVARDDLARMSSAVDHWHAILRPHPAVRRGLATSMLALLAAWHIHGVITCGVYKGKNPLNLSSITDALADRLVALGYPLAEQHYRQEARRCRLCWRRTSEL